MSGHIEPHNERPAAVWSSGGGAYEKISQQIAAALDHCVERLSPAPGERVLDLACGTGWTSRLLARRGAGVTGADFAAGLIETAKARAAEEGLAIDYAVEDAERLSFPNGSFDAVVSTFGVMFTHCPEAAAFEIARVCRMGGRLALAAWKPDGTVFEMFKGSRERLRELFGAGFDLKFEEGTCIYYDRDGEAAWEAFVNGYGPTKFLAASLGEERRAALKRDFIAFHEQFRTELGIAVPRAYLLAIGVRR